MLYDSNYMRTLKSKTLVIVKRPVVSGVGGEGGINRWSTEVFGQ